MFVRLYKYIIGYVVFAAKGGFSERFINLCTVRRIRIWDVCRHSTTITAKINVRDFRKLRNIAKNTGVRISIVSRCGLPFYLRKHKDRAGLLVGAVIFIFFCTFMNNYLWCISVQNGNNISKEQLLNLAENTGLIYGINVGSFDEEKAAREIYKASDGKLSWVKVNIKGSLAVVEYREAEDKLQVEEKGEASNIVADFDGVIISDETYQGAKNKSRGDTVVKGEVLISGIVEGIDMKPLYYQAKGKFSALHTRNLEYTLNNNTEFLNLETVNRSYVLHIFSLKIPIGIMSNQSENTDLLTFDSFLEYEGYILPIGIKQTVAVKHKSRNLSQREKELLTVAEYSNLEYDRFLRTNILSQKNTLTKDGDCLKVVGEYRCIDFIGESKIISLENREFS